MMLRRNRYIIIPCMYGCCVIKMMFRRDRFLCSWQNRDIFLEAVGCNTNFIYSEAGKFRESHILLVSWIKLGTPFDQVVFVFLTFFYSMTLDTVMKLILSIIIVAFVIFEIMQLLTQRSHLAPSLTYIYITLRYSIIQCKKL